MPVQYTSILNEHAAVREKAGVFDISHMGQVFVTGADHLAWLERMLTNRFSKLQPGEGQYTIMLDEKGGVIDDLIAYRLTAGEALLVVNASKIDEDVAWLESHLTGDVKLRNESSAWAGMAVQGPDAVATFAKLYPDETLPPRNGISRTRSGEILCRTGYTGEDGFEFFCPATEGSARFNAFIHAGATPCGLGARDTLRLEMCYPLNGNDLSPQHSPIEAGLGVFCDLDKPDFIGREVLIHHKQNGAPTRLVAIEVTDKAPPPRAHYPVLSDAGEVLGELSSGVLSPTLVKGIAMAYLPVPFSKPGTPLKIDIRGRQFAAVVVKKPFLTSTHSSKNPSA